MRSKRRTLPWQRRQRRLLLIFALLAGILLVPMLTVRPYYRHQAR